MTLRSTIGMVGALTIRTDPEVELLPARRNGRPCARGPRRYPVVVQSDDVLLSTWIVAPASTGHRQASFRPEIEILALD